jgi:hypothetical protein
MHNALDDEDVKASSVIDRMFFNQEFFRTDRQHRETLLQLLGVLIKSTAVASKLNR